LNNPVRTYVRDRLGGLFEGCVLAKIMKEAGLVDVRSDYGSLPVCWGGYVGKLVYEVDIQYPITVTLLTFFSFIGYAHNASPYGTSAIRICRHGRV
jgi:hypothetical protein